MNNIHEAWFGAFERKSIAELEVLLADPFVHCSPFGEIKGKEAYLQLVRANAEAFFSKDIEIIDVFDCGDRIAVQYEIDDSTACDCIYVEDDQIVKINSYYHYGDRPSF